MGSTVDFQPHATSILRVQRLNIIFAHTVKNCISQTGTFRFQD